MRAKQFGFGYLGVAVCAGAILVAAMAVPVHAADDVAAVVAKRQKSMKAMGSSVKTIKDYTEGNADQSAAVEAAKTIQEIGKTVPSV
jgi:hypothetical protein